MLGAYENKACALYTIHNPTINALHSVSSSTTHMILYDSAHIFQFSMLYKVKANRTYDLQITCICSFSAIFFNHIYSLSFQQSPDLVKKRERSHRIGII